MQTEQGVSVANDYAIEMLHITKMFPGIIANDDVTLRLRRGEIHALLGENGAGKSTLMSVLFGLIQPEKGEIHKEGKLVQINNPNDANDLGIGMVHQHFMLVHNFTVLQSIVLGAETTRNGFLKMDDARKRVVELSERYGLKVDPDAIIEDITVGMQQRVEILKMLYRDNEILIFDEPTSVLTPQEIAELMQIMRGLAAEGKSLLFITHKLDEIKAVADRCTVLRKGKFIKTVDVKDVTKEEMSELMVGRKVNFSVEKSEPKPGDAILRLDGLGIRPRHGKPKLKDVTFDVRAGEIVCIAGIDGNGQSELAFALAGMMPITSGTIELCGKQVQSSSIRERNVAGFAHIPEDRNRYGLVGDYSITENMALKSYFMPQFQKKGFLKFGEMYDYADKLIEKFDIRSSQGVATAVRGMSGGNQQKVILAREISLNPELLLAVQPTRGLDVGAIEYIHKQIVAQRDSGKGVLLISLELDEVMNLADRILVIYEGEIVAELDPKKVTIQELGLYMAGGKRDTKGAAV